MARSLSYVFALLIAVVAALPCTACESKDASSPTERERSGKEKPKKEEAPPAPNRKNCEGMLPGPNRTTLASLTLPPSDLLPLDDTCFVSAGGGGVEGTHWFDFVGPYEREMQSAYFDRELETAWAMEITLGKISRGGVYKVSIPVEGEKTPSETVQIILDGRGPKKLEGLEVSPHIAATSGEVSISDYDESGVFPTFKMTIDVVMQELVDGQPQGEGIPLRTRLTSKK